MEYKPDTGDKLKIEMNTYRVFGLWEPSFSISCARNHTTISTRNTE